MTRTGEHTRSMWRRSLLIGLAFYAVCSLLGATMAVALPAPPMTCDANDDGKVTIAELVEGVNNALNGPPPKCGFGCDEICQRFGSDVCPCTGECVMLFDCTPSSLCNDNEAQFDYCFGELTCRAPQ